MDSDMIADLKQFIRAELHQQTTELKSELKTELRNDLRNDIRQARDEILEAIGETMVSRDTAVDEHIANHEERITRLEQRAA